MLAMNKPLAALNLAPLSPLAAEVERRRTFAIISHPDAGKTTLTEKLLLFGGAINLAGQVKAKRDRRSTRSDSMAIERWRARRQIEGGKRLVHGKHVAAIASKIKPLRKNPAAAGFSRAKRRIARA